MANRTTVDRPTCAIELITPALAEEWLAKYNRKNFRKIEYAQVMRYAEDMRNGDWHLNGGTIVFGVDGYVMDGQHRLAAIIESQVTIESFVVRGVTTPALSIDRGKSRTVAQWLRHLGFMNYNNAARIARLIYIYNSGNWGSQSNKTREVPDAVLVDLAIAKQDEIDDAVRASSSCKKLISTSDLAAMLMIGSPGLVSECEMATWFISALRDGENLSRDEAVFHLRKQILEAQGGQKSLSPYMKRMLTTIAWNRSVKNEPTKLLRLRLTGPKKQPAPDTIETADE